MKYFIATSLFLLSFSFDVSRVSNVVSETCVEILAAGKVNASSKSTRGNRGSNDNSLDGDVPPARRFGGPHSSGCPASGENC